MPNLNRVFLMGNLTRDPELRYTPGGMAVTDIGMATNRRIQDKSTGSWREEPTFVDITFWGRQAEVVCQYLSKGNPLFVEGRLQLDQWEDKQTGQKRSRIKVVGERMEFLGGTGSGGGGGQGQGGQQRNSGPPQQSNSQPSPQGGGFGASPESAPPMANPVSPPPTSDSSEPDRSPADSFYDPPAGEGPEDVPF